MELVERDGFLSQMQKIFRGIVNGEGHCILVSGESGIGKTTLVKTFCKKISKESTIYLGTCDALFTPRQLGPILDIIWQMQNQNLENAVSAADRSALFTLFLSELSIQEQTIVLVIEDVHWADEATLDFIKSLARRITNLRCLLLLTYRDDEIIMHHPLRSLLGQLPNDSFSRLQLTHLSKQAVEKMSIERGYNGEDVYTISGGNPFYVSEILASYSVGVPDNVKDSVLSSFNRVDENTKQIWKILSVLPTGLELKYLEKMEPAYAAAIHNCLDLKILILKNGLISFKHELFRRTIEASLSPFLRIDLNKKILDLLKESFENNGQIERILHHAKNANENEIVVCYAYLAAKKASHLGAHSDASKLYLTTIEYYQENKRETLIQFYQSYSYECYLTNQIREAIIYETKALNLLSTADIEKKGNCLRFLSRLWWVNGNREKAETYAKEAIQLLEDQPDSRTKAMVLSNMSQLNMLSHEREDCQFWGQKAIAMAKELEDEETLAHALNNVGTLQMRDYSTREAGIEMLQQSLNLALKNSYEDHAIRAYINLASNAVVMKDYQFAKKFLDEGIQYCEERELDFGKLYLLIFEARQHLEMGDWKEAERIANNVLKNEDQPSIVKIGALIVLATIKMRRGDGEVTPLLLEAKEKTLKTMEPQRIVPMMSALLEYEWITGQSLIEKEVLDNVLQMVEERGNMNENSAFVFWLLKSRKQMLELKALHEAYNVNDSKAAIKASVLWKKFGCPYERALTLFEGNDDNKREAIEIVHKLGAKAVFEKMKFEMRASGIKNIPRGIRKSTQSNPANLTDRELDVLQLLKDGLLNKEIATKLFISPKTVDHHISSIFFKLDVNSRAKAIQEAVHLEIIK